MLGRLVGLGCRNVAPTVCVTGALWHSHVAPWLQHSQSRPQPQLPGLAAPADLWLRWPLPRSRGQEAASAEPAARCRAAGASGCVKCEAGVRGTAGPVPTALSSCICAAPGAGGAPTGSLRCLLLECARNLIDLRAKRNDHPWVCVWGGGDGVGGEVFVFLLLLEIATVVHLPRGLDKR